MSRKVIDLSLKYDEIRDRIEADMVHFKKYEWAEHVKVSQSLVSNVHKKEGKEGKRVNPSLEYIIAVARVTGKPVEWYLYGTPPESRAVQKAVEAEVECTTPENRCPVKCDDDLRELCAKVKEIIDSSWSYSGALKQNIDSFHEAVVEKNTHKQEIEQLNQKITDILREFQNFKKTHSLGLDGDTIKEPASRIAKKRKAG